jgi:rubrerythrin
MAENQIELLTHLHKHELAACEVYKDVLAHVTTNSIYHTLTEFLKDHQRHVDDLTNLIRQFTGDAPSMYRDIKGLLLGGVTTIRSMTGEEGALKALKSAEENVLKHYQAALRKDLTDEAIQDLCQRNLKDEERHGQYLASQVS